MRWLVVAVTLAWSAVPLAQSAPLDDFASWRLVDPGARRLSYLNRPSLFLQNGIALAQTEGVADGVIEFDVVIHGHAGFAGVVFRAESDEDYELIYLRTHRSRQWDALQYTPVFNGNEGWQLYTGDGFNASAELPANRWVHVRLVIEGVTAQVFIDRAPSPQLTVTDLKRPWSRGRVGLWGRSGAASFSAFRATASDRGAPVPRTVAPAAGVLSRWEISQAFATTTLVAERLPGAVKWEQVDADPSGILNIGRHRHLLAPPAGSKDSRSTVFAKASVMATADRLVKLSFGYSDDVTVLLDGQPVFSGAAGYLTRDGSFLGTVTTADSVYLRLTPGRHELIFAVSELFGGWGLSARIDPAAGITVNR